MTFKLGSGWLQSPRLSVFHVTSCSTAERSQIWLHSEQCNQQLHLCPLLPLPGHPTPQNAIASPVAAPPPATQMFWGSVLFSKKGD